MSDVKVLNKMYYFTQVMTVPFAEAVEQVTAALQKEGFGVLTDIDVQATLKRKIDVSFQPYRILGACHPGIAYRMLQLDSRAGVLYPCNVVVQALDNGQVEVAVIDPQAMFQSITHPDAPALILEARQKLQAVLQHLSLLAVAA
jgi:uncharacterized protein (DUF302 family)